MSIVSEKILEEFGLNKKEIAVYLACLECGTSHASHIARKAKLHRSSCYAVLDNLIKHGLVNKSGSEKKFQFTAENPERLVLLIQEKERKVKDMEQKLAKILPELKSIQDTTEELPNIRFIEGVKGIKSVYEDILESVPPGGENWHCGPDVEALIKVLGGDWLFNFIKKRGKKGIQSRAIVEENPWVKKEVKRDKRIHKKIIYLPKEIKIPARLHIYADKVAIFSLKKEPSGVLIEDKNVAAMMRMFFKALWDKYKK